MNVTDLSGDTLPFMKRLWDLVHAIDVRSMRMKKVLGVTGPQRLVIRILGQMPRATASDLAETLGLHPSTLTGILSRLEARGMLKRTVDKADRRRSQIVLTTRGREIDRHRGRTVERAVARVLARSSRASIDQALHVFVALTEELTRE